MQEWTSQCGTVKVATGDCRDVLPRIAENTFHSCVTDPPYHLTSGKKGGTGVASANPDSPAGRSMISTGFMGKAWDGGDVAFRPETWLEVLRVLRPGAHLIAFGGSRTYHRLACAIEDAGFEIRDMMCWLYGSGFPKSLDVSKSIDRKNGERCEPIGTMRTNDMRGGQYAGDKSGNKSDVPAYSKHPITDDAKLWDGWGTALKPAIEPVILARKPLEGTVASNVLKWGCGAINIKASRVEFASEDDKAAAAAAQRLCRDQNENRNAYGQYTNGEQSLAPYLERMDEGRWPANVLHDGSDEVLSAFPNTASGKEPVNGFKRNAPSDDAGIYGGGKGLWNQEQAAGRLYGDAGSAARFFWSPKATQDERPVHRKPDGTEVRHPTVKPLALIEYLVRLVTPPDGECLDCFIGSGTTAEACYRLHMRCFGIELEPDHLPLIQSRLVRQEAKTPLFNQLSELTEGARQSLLFTEDDA